MVFHLLFSTSCSPLNNYARFREYGQWSILLAILLYSCNSQIEGSSDRIEPDSTLNLAYAQGFKVDYYEDVKVVSLISAVDTTRYLLSPNDLLPPEGINFDQKITIPVQRIIAQSTTHLAFLKSIDAENRVVGLENVSYVFDSSYTNRVESGAIQEVGSGNSLNTETVLSLKPDLILVSYMPGSNLSDYQKFISLGIPVLPVAEWTEKHPLGKTEWIKLFAALFNQETEAQTAFNRTQESYTSLIQLAEDVPGKPELIVGLPFQGSWYVPGAESYRNALMQDAGGSWAFSQDSSAVSFPVDFEKMYDLGVQADIWLNPGQAATISEIQTVDSRFNDFKPIQSRRVYNSNRRVNATGTGNDYYESGAIYPQRILADLIKIFHPKLLPHHQLYYYQQLP